jgi:hypothetical protein
MKIPDWKQLQSLAASRLYQLTALFPLIGYLIIFYPGLENAISHPRVSEFRFPLIDSKFRLYLLYYGLLFIGISSILMLRIPRPFLVYRTSDEFADARAGDPASRKALFVDECKALSRSIAGKSNVPEGERFILDQALAAIDDQPDPNLRQIYITYYNIHGYLSPNIRCAIAILFGAGLILLGIISLDTAVAVGERLFHDVQMSIVS